MNKLLKRIKRREGFTLVECIVAVAVFAVMVMLVFMILTNARNEAVNANKSEEDLTKLIDNVVSDETYKKYDDSNVNNLHLEISGAGSGTFDITYNMIDGYKNFVLCENIVDPTLGTKCNYFADNSEFMGTTLPSAFNQANAFRCPKCDDPTTTADDIIQVLVCEDCLQTGDHIDTSKFTYLPENGGFACNECGGTTVRGTNINDYIDANAKLSVSGIVANAIIYGQVEQQTSPEALFECRDASGNLLSGQNVNVILEYDDNTATTGNDSIAGTYTMTITAPFGVKEIAVRLPPYYRIANKVDKYPSVPSTSTDGIDYTSDGMPIGQDGYLVFDFTSGSTATVDFQLVNYKSGFSFDYDYYNSDTSKAGLSKLWFGMNGSLTFNDTNNAIESYSCSRSYTTA